MTPSSAIEPFEPGASAHARAHVGVHRARFGGVGTVRTRVGGVDAVERRERGGERRASG
jgi:hypothetical protein